MLTELPELSDLVIRAIVVISALTFHEFAHAWAAYRAGDETAYRMGRCSLNPLVHLDPIGTIMLFLGPIGWAKPVPVNPANLRRWPKDDIIVSLAGVGANAVMAVGWTVVYGVVLSVAFGRGLNSLEQIAQGSRLLWVLMELSWWGIFLNVALAVFNLLPIPPLDGSHVLGHMLKGQAAARYDQLRRFGPVLLIGFVILNWETRFLLKLIMIIVEPLSDLAETVAAAM